MGECMVVSNGARLGRGSLRKIIDNTANDNNGVWWLQDEMEGDVLSRKERSHDPQGCALR